MAGPSAKDDNMIRTLYNCGYSDPEIAAHLPHLTQRIITLRRIKMGLVPRDRYENVSEDRVFDTPKPAASTLIAKIRRCLRCGGERLSEHAGDRLCLPCRNRPEGE